MSPDRKTASKRLRSRPGAASAQASALELFDPRIRDWFRSRMGPPTDAQEQTWPCIARGEHLLLTAPTGSGKTLAAFLWVINQLVTGSWPLDATHVLYVSPLKALNSDIERNLAAPLAELESVFAQRGDPWPAIRVTTRSGDTPQSERRRQILRPPEIFITTPETLNLMLASRAGAAVFGNLKAVILDEIHAVAGSKRGTHLMTAVERLTELSGEFQRIALSATVEPPEPIAEWVGGWRPAVGGWRPAVPGPADSGSVADERRPVHVLRAKMAKTYEVRVCAPEMNGPATGQPIGGDFWWHALTRRLKQMIASHRSTLIFVNNRRLCERIATLLNEDEPEPIAYSHHGSLSHETRRTIEQRLKDGELPAIVATASLELGIDIGALDQVVLLGTPPAVSSALQRIGRAGHGVGQVSRAVIFPTYARDFVDAAVMAGAVESKNIEPLTTIRAPLDLLAQWIVSMTGQEARSVDELDDAMRRTEAYRELPRARLEDVLTMLSGEANGERMRAYGPLITWNRANGSVMARKGALRSVYLSGGTIADRGYYAMRHEGSGTKIGELDEEFVWEHRPGETFTFGAQAWTIQKITENDVLVKPGNPNDAVAPFWRAEDRSRDTHLSGLIGEWLEEAEEQLRQDHHDAGMRKEESLERWIAKSGRMDDEAAGYLARTMRTQRRVTDVPLPHRHHILAETTPLHGGDPDTLQWLLHLPWGGRVNRPLGLVLAALWEEREGTRPQTFAGNDGIAMHLPYARSAAEMLKEIPESRIEELLRRTLEGSGMFGAHFREAAARSLLLPRGDPRRRMPLWLSRVRSKKLFEAVARHPNFPLIVEAWRSCLQDEFDLDRLREMLAEVREGRIAISDVEMNAPSPFAEGIIWRETSSLMYRGDSTATGASSLSPDLIEEVARTPGLRPTLSSKIIVPFERKLCRVYPEYAPLPGRDLADWVRQRLWIPELEWKELLEAIARDHPDETPVWSELGPQLCWAQTDEGTASAVATRESIERLTRLWKDAGGSLESAPIDERTPGRVPGRFVSGGRPDRATRVGGRNASLADAIAEPVDTPPGEERSEWATWLGSWLSFYGPLVRSRIPGMLGLPAHGVESALTELLENQAIIEGKLTDAVADTGTEICDAENYERLLRISRRAARPSFEALPPEALQLFLAWRQGLTRPGQGPEGLQERLEPLLGFPLSAALFEREFLPARCADYTTSALDVTFQESDLIWTGGGREKVILAFADQVELFFRDSTGEDRPENAESENAEPEPVSPARGDRFVPGRSYTFRELMSAFGGANTDTKTIWEAIWNGQIGAESAIGLRRAVLAGFKPLRDPRRTARGGRRGISRQERWRASDPYPGPWRRLAFPESSADALDELDLQKDRVRVLLDRYGVLFRELLARELPALRWGSVFRTLRLMELGGEVLAGHFFQGTSGLQFIAPEGLDALRKGLPEDAVYWVNATDPASVCGIVLEGLQRRPPARRATTHQVMIGSRTALVSTQMGRKLRFFISPDDPMLPRVLGIFHTWLNRSFDPMNVVALERISGDPAPASPFLAAFRKEFNLSLEPNRVMLWRRYD